jgi:hypothetical protein
VNAIREAINRYTRLGYSVIPCGPDKRPLVPWADHQERRPTTRELRTWFGSDDPPRIGIVCGPVSGGLVAIDLDDLDVAQAVACDLDLQRTTTLVETPSGGCHVWLRQTEGAARCRPLKDAEGKPLGDLKASGGYVLAPPSPGYRFISQVEPLAVPDALAWTAELLRGVGVELDARRNGERPPLGVAGLLAGLQPPIDGQPGNRNGTFTRVAGRLRRDGWPSEDILALLRPHAERVGFSLDELAKIARSVSRYAPVEVGVPPIGRDTQYTPPRELPVATLAQLRDRHSGEVTWVVSGYLARGELVFLAGAGESFKSWVAAHLAGAIDGRFRWMGVLDVDAERVLFVEQERAGNLVYQLNRIEIAERVTLGSERLVILPPTALPLSEPDTVDALEAVIARFRPDVVIINALRDILGSANENSPTDIAALLRPLGLLAERYALCILLLDHFNKSGAQGVVRGSAAHAGTAQKYNEADCVLIAERPRNELGKGEGAATVSTSKRRQGEPGPTFAVSVTDTEDGGVLVRAGMGVIALSPLAQVIKGSLETEGPATVAELAERTGRGKDLIRTHAIPELRDAGLVVGEGSPGKPHLYHLSLPIGGTPG